MADPSLPPSPSGASNGWRHFGFRVTALYFFLFTFPFPIGSLAPGWYFYSDWPWNRLWQKLGPWIGYHVLRHPEAYTARSFSLLDSDSWLQWIQVGCCLVLALAGAVVWTWWKVDQRIEARVRVALRYVLRHTLVSAMLLYGLGKVLLLQMPAPNLNTLRAHYGEFSPFMVLWGFIGYSPAYQCFTGIAEVLAGVLLLFRRTTTLGALLTVAIMTNVAWMNFCYDVEVKINSSHFLLMAMTLVADDARRLVNVLVLNRPTVPSTDERFWPAGTWARGGQLAHGLLLIAIFTAISLEIIPGWKASHAQEAPHPLAGLYEVETFRRDGAEVPPTLTDATRWRELEVGEGGKVTLVNMKGERLLKFPANAVRHEVLGEGRGKLILEGQTHPPTASPIVLNYSGANTRLLSVEGEFNGHPLAVTLHRVLPEDFRLMQSHFHWIRK